MTSPCILQKSAAVLLLTAITPVFGQTPTQRLQRPILEERIAPANSAVLSEVVVSADRTSYRAESATTATRIAEPILDTPRSVQVVTPQVIQDRKINDPQEAVQNVSGVQRSGARAGSGETYIVRGFRQQSLFKDGFRAGELSGSSLFTFGGPTDIANIERIEVLKGPSAILFGRGEPGGTVNYITKQPTFEKQFSLEQQVGSYDFYRSELNANFAIVPDKFALRLDAAYENNESFIDFVEGERFFIAPAFKWQIGADTTLTFRGEYSNDDRSTSTGVPYANGQVIPGMPYNRYFGEPGVTEMETEAWRGLLTLEHRWNESHRTTASVHGARTEADGINFILFNFAGPLQDPVTGDIARAAEDVDFTSENFTARLDHVWDTTFNDGGSSTITDKDGKSVSVAGSRFPILKNQLLISAEFERQTTEGFRVLSSHSPLNPKHPNYTGFEPRPLLPFPGFPLRFGDDRSTDADALSVLLMDRFSIGETVFITLGGRYEWFNANSQFAYDPSSGFGSANNDVDEQTFNPFVGIVFKPARNISLYGSFAESTYSFKNIDSATVTGQPLDAERARQFEVGAKGEFFDGKLLVTAALFQIDKTDVAAEDPNNPFFVINAGEEQSRGFEFDIAGEPLPGWRISANYAYIDARVSDDPLGTDLNNRLPGIPEHSGGVFTTYEIQNGPLKGLGFGGGAYFCDRVEYDRGNTGDVSGWAQVDALVYYKRDRFRAQINVKNLLDEEFYYTGSFGGDEVQRAAARTVIASVRFDF
jgi:iron complex outermembrane receptor protein